MKNSREDLINYYLEKKRKGVGFSEIRRELTGLSIQEDLITEIIRNIDDIILKEELEKSERNKENRLKLPGYILMVFGLLVTLATYTSIIDLHGRYIIVYGPVIAGYFMVRASNINNKKHNKHRTAFLRRRN